MATLTTTVIESLTLNGSEQGGTNTFTVTGVNEVYKIILTCTNDVDTTLVTFRAAVNTNDSAVDIEDVRYVRITNLDSADDLHISLQIDTGTDGADHQTTILVSPGQSLMLGKTDAAIATSDDGAAVDTALNDVESIIAHPPGSDALDVEIFIASV